MSKGELYCKALRRRQHRLYHTLCQHIVKALPSFLREGLIDSCLARASNSAWGRSHHMLPKRIMWSGPNLESGLRGVALHLCDHMGLPPFALVSLDKHRLGIAPTID